MWFLKKATDMDQTMLLTVMAARVSVFVVEQKCYYQEIDTDDFSALHLMMLTEEGELQAYARIIDKGDFITFGRILVLPKWRHTGLGKSLVEETITQIKTLYPSREIKIEAQAYLVRFYTSFGFVATSDIYNIDNIPHIDMSLT